MTTPSGFALRPRSLGELLDLPFRVYRHRIGMFAAIGVGIALLQQGSAMVYQIWLYRSFDPLDPGGDPVAVLAGVFLGFPVYMLIIALTYTVGALPIIAASRDAVVGEDRPAAEVFRDSWRRLLPAIVTSVVVWIMVGLGFLACLVPGVFMATALSLALPVVYLESRSPFGAVARSWELIFARGRVALSADSNWIRVVVLGVVSGIVLYALMILASLPIGLVQAIVLILGKTPVMTVLGPQPLPLIYMMPLYLVGAVLQGVFLAIAITPWSVLYLDIRARHEGYDLERAIEMLRRDGDR